MKAAKIVLRILPFVLVGAVLVSLLFYPAPRSAVPAEKKLVEVWNVDTFEGGKGSRTAFLERVAKRLMSEDPDIYYHVVSYTSEGAEAAFSAGNYPAVLSYGVGLPSAKKFSLPLPYNFEGASAEGETLAFPWCRGEYMLFCMEENFDKEGKTAISCGKNNLAPVAAAIDGIEGEELPSSEAYTSFLAGEYRYLLGTQRDRFRFQTRGVAVYERVLPAYCDLYDCVSLFREEGKAFVEELLSERTKTELPSIGMLPFENEEGTLTPDLFSSEKERETVLDMAHSQSDAKNLGKLLKTV